MTRALPTSVTVPAGRYVVGDPCYAIADDAWDAWLEAADYQQLNQGKTILEAKVDGHLCVGVTTKYGDGEYCDQYGRSYPVDAGLIGLVPCQVATADVVEDKNSVVLEFSEPVECWYDDETGVIHLGDIEIDTDDAYLDDEDDGYDYEDKDDEYDAGEDEEL